MLAKDELKKRSQEWVTTQPPKNVLKCPYQNPNKLKHVTRPHQHRVHRERGHKKWNHKKMIVEASFSRSTRRRMMTSASTLQKLVPHQKILNDYDNFEKKPGRMPRPRA